MFIYTNDRPSMGGHACKTAALVSLCVAAVVLVNMTAFRRYNVNEAVLAGAQRVFASGAGADAMKWKVTKLRYGYRARRILCWIPTLKRNRNRHLAAYSTWGERCGTLLFVYADSSLKKPRLERVSPHGRQAVLVGLPAVAADGESRPWQRTADAYNYIAGAYGLGDTAPYDWVLKAKHDSYVFVENLLKYTDGLNQEDPYYYGFMVATNSSNSSIDYIDGSAMIMSRVTVGRLVAGVDAAPACRRHSTGVEEVDMAVCLLAVGVRPAHAVDAKGRLYFSPTHPLATVNSAFSATVVRAKGGPAAPRLNCCARRMVAFGRVAAADARLFEYFAYRFDTRL